MTTKTGPRLDGSKWVLAKLSPGGKSKRMRTVFPVHYTWPVAISGGSSFIIL